jgi:branched-chain amino acid transport system substrate-binding protein
MKRRFHTVLEVEMRVARALALATLTLVVAACEKKKEAPAGAPQPAAAEKTAAGAGGGDTILLGHVASMSGEQATFGASTDNAVRLAIEEQNAKGGVKGKKIAVKTLDDQGKPEEAAVATTRLITDDKVVLVLGEVASSRSLAMAPIADQMKVPMISPSSTNPKVTKDGDRTRPFVFRVCFIDPFQGTVMAKFAIENLKVKNVAVLRDVGNDYSVGLADFFSAKFKELGGTIVTDQSFKAGDQDFKAQLTTIKNKKPDAVFVPGYYTDVALIGRQARELGMKVPLLGGDGWDSAKLYEIAQGALDGSFFSNHYTHENPAPVIQDFVKKYKEKYGDTPDALAAMGYDAAKVAIAAIERAPDLSGAALAQAIAQTKDFEGVTGTININEDHNAVKSAVVLGIEKNAAKYATSIAP